MHAVSPSHMQIPNFGTKQYGYLLGKNPQINGPAWFKSVLFRGQWCVCVCVYFINSVSLENPK